MKLAIIGCRWYNNYSEFKKEVWSFLTELEVYDRELHPELEIVSGGASGTDAMAKRLCKEYEITYTEFPVFWNTRPENMHPAIHRNKQIAEYSNRGLAFWDKKSRGTLSTINFFNQLNKSISIKVIKQ